MTYSDMCDYCGMLISLNIINFKNAIADWILDRSLMINGMLSRELDMYIFILDNLIIHNNSMINGYVKEYKIDQKVNIGI